MKYITFLIGELVLLILLVVGCSPSPEARTTMTAAAWTPTPLPTATPTPLPTATLIPYDLAVKVTDSDGNPIVGALIKLAELSEHETATQVTDDSGQVSWLNLPGEQVSLTIQSQGYYQKDIAQTIQRGANGVYVILERDPFGLLPIEACRPEETLLYIEDFQDKKAQNWDEITAALDNNAQSGWAITEDEAGNFVLTTSRSTGFANATLWREGFELFDNAVWRLRIKFSGKDSDANLNWRKLWNQRVGQYIVKFGDGAFVDLSLSPNANSRPFVVGSTTFQFKENQWYLLEVGTFEGTTELWIDGKKMVSHISPQPLSLGTIGFWVDFHGSDSIYMFNDLVVCGINSLFETIYVQK